MYDSIAVTLSLLIGTRAGGHLIFATAVVNWCALGEGINTLKLLCTDGGNFLVMFLRQKSKIGIPFGTVTALGVRPTLPTFLASSK